MKCLRCTAEATFSSPENLCDVCWSKWWVKGLNPKNAQERETLMKETIGNINDHKNTTSKR